MRCTAPMNAPWPPPTMPRRSRRPSLPSPLPSIAMPPSSADAEHAPVRRLVGALADEVLERGLGHPDEVRGDELGALARAVLGMLQAAFPLQHRPAAVIVAGELGEDGAEIDLAVAERAEAPGAVQPRLEARV